MVEFTSARWIMSQLSNWLSERQIAVADLVKNNQIWLEFVRDITRHILHDQDKVTPQDWFDHREALAIIDHARTKGELASYLPSPRKPLAEVDESNLKEKMVSYLNKGYLDDLQTLGDDMVADVIPRSWAEAQEADEGNFLDLFIEQHKVSPRIWSEAAVDEANKRGERPLLFTTWEEVQKENPEVIAKIDTALKGLGPTYHQEIVEDADRLINPKTLIDQYRVAIRQQKYEEAGELWNQMSEPERARARTLASHRRAMRKFAFNDMLGKGWDSGKQFSFCMQRSLAGDPQFWWVPEVVRKFPVPPPNWESVKREPDGRFKEFPGRGKGKKKKEKKSSARATLCRFALNLYFEQHPEEGRRILSLLREIK